MTRVAGPRPMCWAAGFKGLHEKPFVAGSLRYLDRTRSQQIRKFDGVPLRYGNGKPGQGVRRRDPVGYAFSYAAQFMNRGGQNLIQNPWRPRNVKETVKCLVFTFCQRSLSLIRRLNQ